jgi:hypothetical protein
MAERRRTRSAKDDEPADARQLADRDEQELVDEDEPEPSDQGDQELVDEDEPEPAEDDKRSANGKGRGTRRPRRKGDSVLTAKEAARVALRQIVELTAKQPEGITGVQHTEDGWTIDVEVVEDRRIPSSADILATYEATIDMDGELMSYRRVRRYTRGRGDSSEGS